MPVYSWQFLTDLVAHRDWYDFLKTLWKNYENLILLITWNGKDPKMTVNIMRGIKLFFDVFLNDWNFFDVSDWIASLIICVIYKFYIYSYKKELKMLIYIYAQ